MSRVYEWCANVVDNIITIPRLTVGVAIFFALAMLVVMWINGSGSSIAKLGRANKRANKFHNNHTSIDYSNILIYKKKVISKLPAKCRKQWTAFEASGKPVEKSLFAPTLREVTNKGGAVGFAIYLYLYILMTILMVVAMCFSSMNNEIASLYVCGSLVAGAIGLFVVGFHLYCLDKKASKNLDSYLTNMVSRMLVFKAKNYTVEAAIADVNARRREAAAKQAACHAVDSSDSIYCPSTIEDRRAMAADSATKPVVVNSSFRASDFNKLEGLLVNEARLKEGYATMESLGNCPVEDSISRLDRLVSRIMKDKNCSPELIETIYDCISAAIESKYARPIDELRMRCVIRKLKQA